MEEISSYRLHVNQKVEVKGIIRLYQLASKSPLNIYLYRENMIADARNLPKLLSFFFVTSEDPIVMIIDGENAEEGYTKFKTILDQQSIKSELRVNHKIYQDKSIAI